MLKFRPWLLPNGEAGAGALSVHARAECRFPGAQADAEPVVQLTAETAIRCTPDAVLDCLMKQDAGFRPRPSVVNAKVSPSLAPVSARVAKRQQRSAHRPKS